MVARGHEASVAKVGSKQHIMVRPSRRMSQRRYPQPLVGERFIDYWSALQKDCLNPLDGGKQQEDVGRQAQEEDDLPDPSPSDYGAVGGIGLVHFARSIFGQNLVPDN